MLSSFRVVIPARYQSTRLPGKPLLDIAGKPMIAHVHDRALASGAEQVVIATDDQRIADVAHEIGAEVCMTSTSHRSGTDRIAEVVTRLAWGDEDTVVNLQGDEPDMPPNLITEVAGSLSEDSAIEMATLATPIKDQSELFDPNVVKVVLNTKQSALYFSRAPIPWNRDEFNDLVASDGPVDGYLRHIGLYAYRVGFIKRFVSWEQAPLEQLESLEQLRALWNGAGIHVNVTDTPPPPGVDTVEDLKRVTEAFVIAH